MYPASISYSPTSEQLAQIESWLITEQKENDKGFYCNWEAISNAFQKNLMAVISKEGNAIGFVIWHCSSERTVTLNIIEIKPAERRKGYGKVLTEALMAHLLQKGIMSIDANCLSTSSEKLLCGLGYLPYPETESRKEGKYLYKIMIPYLEQAHSETATVELWNNEPYCTNTVRAKWKWETYLLNTKGELILPIIHPCSADWRIRYTVDGKTVRDNKVKYFTTDEIYFSGYMILKNLPIADQRKINPIVRESCGGKECGSLY
ncbi:MAG TPA: GNAT family N-acetyltransferase [Sphingobacteriaceae bacterium]